VELLYHVDENDEVLGSVERTRAHGEQLLHRAGVVFLARPDGTILIQHRSRSKETFPGRLDASASFHVTFGERYDEAAARELREETGVSASLNFVGKFTHHDPPEHEIVAVFLGVSEDRVAVDPAESEGFEFLSLVQVDGIVASQEITPWFRDGWKIARAHLKT
jgi:isopentenyldiphosphate isomerase